MRPGSERVLVCGMALVLSSLAADTEVVVPKVL
jgi:hypothetical protein